MIDELALDEEFCCQFNRIFHQTVEELREPLEKRAATFKNRLHFEYVPQNEVKGWHVLAEVASITEPLTNWAIDAAANKTATHKSRIEVRTNRALSGKHWLRFRILCDFDSLDAINDRVTGGRNYNREVRKLKLYGGLLPERWQPPSPFEKEEGFKAVYEFDMPTGLIPRKIQ